MSLVIVDTGVANLSSVKFAFDRLGVEAVISDKVETITKAQRVILPGVGAAPYAMKSINAKGLTPALRNLTQPVMGICLGMQLIFETLEEGGSPVKGLGLVPGTVKALNTKKLPSPHMGWNTLTKKSDDPLLEGINDNDYAYFVHSFAAPVTNITLATSEYGEDFSAIVRHKNVYGCQFHPERSSRVGAKILENFLKVPA
ncbi:imidazole glycerol phosphate synthase subunit HisH [Hellea balneolensis]|uniref:imidazole glycerol phosphate synthase subunit HisH n=1 Tax=Hellea balneolensis TaxID=287478 RepID=UPI0003F81156|nr:imidazole glycerol phosphate synthase subunit HisH [Hellea balneolensis]